MLSLLIFFRLPAWPLNVLEITKDAGNVFKLDNDHWIGEHMDCRQ